MLHLKLFPAPGYNDCLLSSSGKSVMCNCFMSVAFCKRKETGGVCVLAACRGKAESRLKGLNRKQDFRAGADGRMC